MSFNKQYNTRFSTGRYNTPGQFVPAGETFGQTPRSQPPPQQHLQQHPQPVQVAPKDEDVKMAEVEAEAAACRDDDPSMPPRPYWMKIKKISNKERRRRQNENLRRLLTPKNALMVLNEMKPNEQVANQFKVEPSAANAFYKASNTHNFCADLTIDGNNYKGYGDNKLMARNAAAEQAIRDLIIKKMNKIINSDNTSLSGAAGDSGSAGDAAADEEALPMIQLASFALHKLFSEWECEGHKVPQLKPNSLSTSDSAEPAAKLPKELPANAAHMHPCMLLTYMRPHLEYRELAVAGDRPQNIVFTMGVDVDGATYVGKASNKKEARKLAAKAACQALFNVNFVTTPAPQ